MVVCAWARGFGQLEKTEVAHAPQTLFDHATETQPAWELGQHVIGSSGKGMRLVPVSRSPGPARLLLQVHLSVRLAWEPLAPRAARTPARRLIRPARTSTATSIARLQHLHSIV